MPEDYTDIRAIMDNYERRECHACGWEYWERLDTQPRLCCRNCFMGLRGGNDPERECVTGGGHVDYRLLWYGDIPLDEAREKYRENTKETRERMERHRAEERAVSL